MRIKSAFVISYVYTYDEYDDLYTDDPIAVFSTENEAVEFVENLPYKTKQYPDQPNVYYLIGPGGKLTGDALMIKGCESGSLILDKYGLHIYERKEIAS